VLSTLHLGQAGSLSPGQHARRIASQLRAMMTYCLALIYRTAVSPFRGFDRKYVLWPVFLMTVESGNVLGKVYGLIASRGCRRNPYPNARLAAFRDT